MLVRYSWYPTLCNLVGVDPADTVVMNGTARPIGELKRTTMLPLPSFEMLETDCD